MKRLLSISLLLVALLCLTGAQFPFSFWKKAAAAATPAAAADTFNRTDANPISSGGSMSDGVSTWSAAHGNFNAIQLYSNQAWGTGTGYCGVAVASPAFAGDQKATVTLVGNGEGACPVVRMQSNSAICYTLYVTGGSVYVWKLDVNGSPTNLGSISSAVAAGDTLGLSASGTSPVTLTVFVNGSSIGTKTDSSATITGGQPGMFLSEYHIVDNFVAADL